MRASDRKFDSNNRRRSPQLLLSWALGIVLWATSESVASVDFDGLIDPAILRFPLVSEHILVVERAINDQTFFSRFGRGKEGNVYGLGKDRRLSWSDCDPRLYGSAAAQEKTVVHVARVDHVRWYNPPVNLGANPVGGSLPSDLCSNFKKVLKLYEPLAGHGSDISAVRAIGTLKNNVVRHQIRTQGSLRGCLIGDVSDPVRNARQYSDQRCWFEYPFGPPSNLSSDRLKNLEQPIWRSRHMRSPVESARINSV